MSVIGQRWQVLNVQDHSEACGQYVQHPQAEAPGHQQLLEAAHLQPEEDNIHQLRVEFHANKKAWMTSNHFNTWLCKQDRIFTRQKRKVALILDNCTAHPNINSTLKSINLIFLPPNTTSVTQPMDQGIIASKTPYLHHFVQHVLLKAMETGKDFNWTVLDAIYGVEATWNKITSATIKNYFNYCNFVATSPAPEDYDDPDDDIPFVQLIERLRHAGIEVSSEDEAVYNTVDNNLLTAVPMTVQDIAKEVLDDKAAKDMEDDIAEEEEEGEDPAPPVQHTTMPMLVDFTTAMKDVLCSFTEDTSEMWAHLTALEKFFQWSFIRKQKKTIQDFFKAAPPPVRPVTADEDDGEVC